MVKVSVCDSCLDAAYDEGIDDDATANMVMLELGADLADHLCDQVETDGETSCACACRRR